MLVQLHIFLLRALTAQLDETLTKNIASQEISEEVVAAVGSCGLQVSHLAGNYRCGLDFVFSTIAGASSVFI